MQRFSPVTGEDGEFRQCRLQEMAKRLVLSEMNLKENKPITEHYHNSSIPVRNAQSAQRLWRKYKVRGHF
jgi:hypothetical protein